ncbi:response regulator [Maribellus comscasis]|uniref:Response regulator n=1 Tax=Maribellus comscasis TaxID=2681766 RepID=A0A6I6KDA3_9BACT|nr:response regulator [Maribellus comscasis]
MKTVIIEDEKRTAQDLADTLKKIDGDLEIVSILSSVKQAVEFFKTEDDFNLIFSDIQLTDGLCFNIFKSIKITVPVIFCTAFDKYTLEAFNANGIHYILKPFNKSSVSEALVKYQTLKLNFTTQDNNKLIQKAEQQITKQPASSIIINQGEKIIPINIQEIALFYCENKYVFALTFNQKKHILTHSVEELEGICGASFFRANRQYLVSRKAIKDASRHFNRKILINLTIAYSEKILVSRLKAPSFIAWLAQV